MIVYGTRMCGRVDETQVGHVATRFVHVWFVPLVPLGSFFVVGESAKPVPFSVRSVLIAYVRSFGVVATLLCGAFFLYFVFGSFWGDLEIYMNGGSAVTEEDIIADAVTLAVSGTIAVLGIVLFVATRFFRKASAARCVELTRVTGFQVSPL